MADKEINSRVFKDKEMSLKARFNTKKVLVMLGPTVARLPLLISVVRKMEASTR